MRIAMFELIEVVNNTRETFKMANGKVGIKITYLKQIMDFKLRYKFRKYIRVKLYYDKKELRRRFEG
ncbi:hypothetical protein ACI65C_011951 [Semiaphis heraclei]